MVAMLNRWLEEGVDPLRIRLVSVRALPGRRYVGTIQFSSDARAVPAYAILIFQAAPSAEKIVGATTGIRGSSYEDANWTVTRSRHFTVYHSPYQLAGSDASVLGTLEAQRSLFERKFGVHVAPLTRYYLYPDQRSMARMSLGNCGRTPEYVGCALPYVSPPSIQTIEWPSYHEPVHVFERALEPPFIINGNAYMAPLFIGEGTAVALEDRQLDPRLSDYCSDLAYVPLDSCARQAAAQVDPLKILADSGFTRGDIGDNYLIGGSFVKYLILHYGYRAFGKFYYKLAAQPKDRLRDYDVATKSIYHASMTHLLSRWRAALCVSGC